MVYEEYRVSESRSTRKTAVIRKDGNGRKSESNLRLDRFTKGIQVKIRDRVITNTKPQKNIEKKKLNVCKSEKEEKYFSL